MDITKAFPLLMQQEGIQLTNVAGDKGGLTKFGIAKASHPNLDIANLTEDQARDIYLNEYWQPCKCGELKPELQYIHFSAAVNLGVVAANKVLQRAAKVKDDGVVGPATIGAAQAISIYDYSIEWNLKYDAIIAAAPDQVKFQKGWQFRINTIINWFKAGKL